MLTSLLTLIKGHPYSSLALLGLVFVSIATGLQNGLAAGLGVMGGGLLFMALMLGWDA